MGTQPTPISIPSLLMTAPGFWAHWKTTICGLAGAALLAVQTYNGGGGWKGYAGAVVIAVFGAMAKDFNV